MLVGDLYEPILYVRTLDVAQYLHNIFLFCLLLEELSEDMETSSETTTGPLDTTKDSCNLGVKRISKETGMLASTRKACRHIL